MHYLDDAIYFEGQLKSLPRYWMCKVNVKTCTVVMTNLKFQRVKKYHVISVTVRRWRAGDMWMIELHNFSLARIQLAKCYF